MALDSQIISLVVRRPERLVQLQHLGVTADDLVEPYSVLWNYIVRMKRNHGSVPSKAMVEARYPEMHWPVVRERDIPIIVHNLKERTKFNRFLNVINNAARQCADPDDLDVSLQLLQGELNQIQMSHGATPLVDMFGQEYRDHIVAEIRERRAGRNQGLATGFTTFDNVAGGLQKQRMVVIIGRTGLGKAQPLDARVMTPTGWAQMGLLRVGSSIITPTGQVAKVVAVHPQGFQDVYRVTLSDGTFTEATEDHLWLTSTFNERRYGAPSVKTTSEIASSLKNREHHNHYLPMVAPYDWPDQNQPVDPYVLGALSSWQKFIPKDYLFASAKTRLSVLQGLLDTNGSALASSAEYCTTSPTLAEQAVWLVQSLGGTARTTWRTTYYSSHGERKAGRRSARIYITLPEGMDYFRFNQKRLVLTTPHLKKQRAVRTIRSVEFVGRKECRCITVSDTSGLYITDNFIVTHNSWIDLLFVAEAIRNNAKVILYPLEMSMDETAMRLYTIFSQKVYGGNRVLRNLDLTKGQVSKRKFLQLLDHLQNQYEGRLLISDIGKLSTPYTIERIEAEVEIHQPDMFWVDYLTLLKAPNPNGQGDDFNTIRALSGGIKGIATRHNVVGGCSAQVNREALRVRAFLPRLEHIAYGDSIGQDADQVFSINRKGDKLYWALVKNRSGPEIGKVTCDFLVNSGIIRELEVQEEDSEV